MRIVHIHLLDPYTEGWGYQENVLPRVQAKEGHSVIVITNCLKHTPDGDIIEVEPGEYMEGQVRIIRLKMKSFFNNKKIDRILIRYPIFELLNRISPDIILLHGLGGGLTNYQIRKYMRLYGKRTKLFGDSHAIKENTDVSRNNLKGIIRFMYIVHCKKILYPYYTKIFGVTPECIEFAKKYYNTPCYKMLLFPLGYDPDVCDISKKQRVRKSFRTKYGISEDVIVILHGGKIVPRRNTELAIKAFLKIQDKNAKMIIFGDISPEMNETIISLVHKNRERIYYLGHLSQSDYIKVMLSSDIGFFPGAQSALWQEAIGCGLPLVLGRAKGIDYLNCGGNMISVKRSDLDNAICVLDEIIQNDKLSEMRRVAESSAREFFSYARMSKMMTEDTYNDKESEI